VNIDTITTLIGILCCVGIVSFEFAEIKGDKIILHVKLPTFKTDKLKGFTITKFSLHFHPTEVGISYNKCCSINMPNVLRCIVQYSLQAMKAGNMLLIT